MIVYASRLDLLDRDPRGPIRKAVRDWLSRKMHRTLGSAVLRSGQHDLGRGQRLQVEELEAGDAWSVAYRYSHPDSELRGRTWHTELGVSSDGGRSYCTSLLQTDEQSTLVRARPETTRPWIVQGIQRVCRLRSSTPGGVARTLTLEDAEAFLSIAQDRKRPHPIVQISHRPDGTVLLDPRRIADLCLGVADVVVIPAEVDTFSLAREVGQDICPFHGAVNLLWPAVRRGGSTVVPTTRILADDLDEIASRGLLPERECLARICHYTNPGVARGHVSVERVRAERLHHALELARASSGPALDPELQALAEEIDREQRQKIEALSLQVSDLERDLKAMEEERDEARRKATALEGHLNARPAGGDARAVPDELSDCILRVIGDEPSLEDSLTILSHVFPSRLVVLPSAWQSAREASGFRRAGKAFELLRTLCTAYYDAMVAGRGDQGAQQAFGPASFATRESEGVENNKRARALRTFVYKSQPVPMMRHLKIGVKDSIAETFRAHFHWDAEEKKIVLGHCGRHLDHG